MLHIRSIRSYLFYKYTFLVVFPWQFLFNIIIKYNKSIYYRIYVSIVYTIQCRKKNQQIFH